MIRAYLTLDDPVKSVALPITLLRHIQNLVLSHHLPYFICANHIVGRHILPTYPNMPLTFIIIGSFGVLSIGLVYTKYEFSTCIGVSSLR